MYDMTYSFNIQYSIFNLGLFLYFYFFINSFLFDFTSRSKSYLLVFLEM